MEINQLLYRSAFAFAIAALLILGSPRLSAAQSHAGPRKAIPAPSAPEPGIHGVGSGVTMTFTDPKTGKVLWTANVKRVEATSKANANDVTGTMHGVDGVLYQDSVAADRLQAPTVTVDNASQLVDASGGVTVTSLTQANTRITCDKMTYYASKAKIVGHGHVVFHKGGFTQKGPSFAADVKLKAVVMPAPGEPGSSKPGVHVDWRR
ncbi:MAG: LPS export ABC transporter periplasmic protein LptC [Capsulimonadaceae bacterium]|nr:LPS export ABC transporter periplasmic protein LptC [Capsulimonadaceae bacterium]